MYHFNYKVNENQLSYVELVNRVGQGTIEGFHTQYCCLINEIF